MGEEFEIGKVYVMLDGKWEELAEGATLEIVADDHEEDAPPPELVRGEWSGTLEIEAGFDKLADALREMARADAAMQQRVHDLYLACLPVIAVLRARRAKVKAMRAELKRKRRSARR